MPSYDDRLSEWRCELEQQRTSGLSVSDWCAERGISKQSFYYRRRRVAPSTPPSPVPEWLPVSVHSDVRVHALTPVRSSPHTPNTASAPGPVTATPANTIILRIGRVAIDVAPGFDRQHLSDLMSVLEQRC